MIVHDAHPGRILHYCHDTYGLGHLRRALSIAHHLHSIRPGIAQLIVTGSPLATDLPLPPGTDTLKLPCVIKTGDDRYAVRSMPIAFESVRALRGALLLEAVRHFRPDLILVDHAPGGMKGEAVRALNAVRHQQPDARIVLGLRDIVDAPARTQAAWAAGGIIDLLERVYDSILVYGQREVFDSVAAYGLSTNVAAKLSFVGYLRRRAESVPQEHADLVAAGAPPFVLATAGGGGDGVAVLTAFLRAAASWPGGPPFRPVTVAGPFMSDTDRAALHATAAGVRGARVLDFVAGLSGLVANAAAVVSMAGYNTTCEILSFRRPAVLVPRTAPRQEQLIRAAALARRGEVAMITPDALTPPRLRDAIDRALSGPSPAGQIDLGGLDRVAAALVEMLDHPDRAAASSRRSQARSIPLSRSLAQAESHSFGRGLTRDRLTPAWSAEE